MEYSKECLKNFMFKEIDIIQDNIKRMASNSFIIKGWCLSLVVATLLLSEKYFYGFIALIPLIVFWFLDSYFLQQEKLFRKLYSWVIENRQNTDDFLFSLDIKRFKKEVPNIFKIMFSLTLGLLYGSIFLMIIIYIFFIIYKKGCF